MATPLTFDLTWLNQLLNNPDTPISGSLAGHSYTAGIIIPRYKDRVVQRYRELLSPGPLGLEQTCRNAEIQVPFDHFGVTVKFERPLEVVLYDDGLVINKGLCDIMARVGPLVLKNVYLQSAVREYGHRNRFPHLQFHIDRSANQPTRYSMYTRDPFDEEQKHPRTSSTLFSANIISYLQGTLEGSVEPGEEKGVRSSLNLFKGVDMSTVINDVVAEHSWDEPEGVGEISMIDNATTLHASYYRDADRTGYRIGVRYLKGNDL